MGYKHASGWRLHRDPARSVALACELCSFSTTAASYEPTLGVWTGVSPRIQKKIARCGFVSKTYPKPYLLADFNLNCYNAYAAAHPHFRASWCITGASCTVKVHVHHNASPVHHTVHHRVHQKGALRCIKAGWLNTARAACFIYNK